MPAPQNLRATGDRIEQLLDELQATADPRSYDRAAELLRLVSELYGAGLARVVELAREQAPGTGRRVGRGRPRRQPAAGARAPPRDPRAPGARRPSPGSGRCSPPTAATWSCSTSTQLQARFGFGSSAVATGAPRRRSPSSSAVERAIIEAAPEIVAHRRRRAVDGPTWSVPVALGDQAACTRNARRRWPARERPSGRAAADPRDRARARSRARGERCELCGEPISDEHGHLVDLAGPQPDVRLPGLLPAVHLRRRRAGSHYRAVPDRYLAFPDFQLSPAQWDSLQIPVSVAFFFLNSSLGRVAAFYPGPAGATESELPLDTWAEVVAANPELATLAARRRGVPRASRPEPRRGGVLSRSDRRLLRAGRPSPSALAGLRRRHARPTTRSTASSTACALEGAMTALASR